MFIVGIGVKINRWDRRKREEIFLVFLKRTISTQWLWPGWKQGGI